MTSLLAESHGFVGKSSVLLKDEMGNVVERRIQLLHPFGRAVVVFQIGQNVDDSQGDFRSSPAASINRGLRVIPITLYRM